MSRGDEDLIRARGRRRGKTGMRAGARAREDPAQYGLGPRDQRASTAHRHLPDPLLSLTPLVPPVPQYQYPMLPVLHGILLARSEPIA